MTSPDHSTLEEGLIEDSFDIRFNVFEHVISLDTGLPEITSFQVFQYPFIMPCQELLQDIPGFLRTYLSNYLSDDDVQSLAAQIISYAQETRYTTLDTSHHRLIPLFVDLHLPSPYEDDPEMTETDWVIEQSMQEVSMVPAAEKAVASLKKLEVSNDEIKAERCNICLENFKDEKDLLGMPCRHIYHKDCIVKWLKINHMCPLCRFPMPVE